MLKMKGVNEHKFCLESLEAVAVGTCKNVLSVALIALSSAASLKYLLSALSTV